MTPSNILIVDDTPANLDVLCGMLRDRGYRVRVAISGARALIAMRAERPDLVMLDINMPGMSGYDVCRELKRDESLRNVPVIFISALDEVIDKVKAFEAGGADYVAKPFEFGEVLARIEHQLKIAALQRQLEVRNAELMRMNEELLRSQQRESRIFNRLSDELPGTVLDQKYRIDSRIGSGGFGTVFRGVQLSLDRPVAIKIFQALAAAARPEELERFRREGISACRVNHPNALGIIDSGVSQSGIAYLVSELLEGQTLRSELATYPRLTIPRTASILLPVCEVLTVAHAIGLVHRDIKPDNIFLHRGRDGEVVKVLDFGIAKLTGSSDERTLTAARQVVGTPFYMAPERFRSEPHDGRADVYSLGVLAYEMLTGGSPFDADTSVEAMAVLHLNAPPVPLRNHVPDASESLERVILAALDKEPRCRPTAEEFGQVLSSASAPAPQCVPATRSESAC
ncbi:MAG TPA: protein kinase [Thermoanaerobaculia bacterium]|nr:protein kinase [Thermoanaerobaculia bacterium]